MTKAAYRRYLLSPWWRSFRARYYKRFAKQCCVCGAKQGIELHHLTYDRIGGEYFSDVVPVCPKHHHQIHHGLLTITGVKWVK